MTTASGLPSDLFITLTISPRLCQFKATCEVDKVRCGALQGRAGHQTLSSFIFSFLNYNSLIEM